MQADEIAAALQELADRSLFAGESPFKARAYHEAARRVAEGLVDLSDPDRLEEASGIGSQIAGKVRRMLQGELPPSLVRMRKEQPAEITALLRLPGVGPSTMRRLWAAGIGRVAELEERLERGEVLAGVTPHQRAQILRAFAVRREGVPLPELLEATARLARAIPGIEPAGGLRLLDPTVREPRWLAPASEEGRSVWRDMRPLRLPGEHRLGEDAVQFVPQDEMGPALLVGTGPQRFVAEVREALERRGLSLRGDKLFEGHRPVPCPGEADLFRLAGIDPVPPTLRGLDPDARGRAPREVLGDLHAHSNWSDGQQDIRTMAEGALSRGYRYLAITDHSQGLKVANGLSPERLSAQRAEIREVQRSLPEGFTLLQGCEVDIHPDGSLDLPDDALARLDVVIASVHNRFDQSVEEATARLVRAISHPLVTAVGHPGARKLGVRGEIPADWERVFDAARREGKALELNASPRRLDLDFRRLRGRAQGLSFLIDTDAHSTAELGYMPLGIAQAQKAGVQSAQVLNASALSNWLRRPVRR